MTISELAQAIARFEGPFVPGTRSYRNNNPGNLRTWGTLPRDAAGYAIFPNPEAGWAALERQVSLNIARGLTLEEFFAGKPGVYPGYAPSADANDPANYARTVAGWLGIAVDQPLTGYAGGAGPPDPSPGSASEPRKPGRKRRRG
jgi:hypothetical protein